jgi:hypothetical protein
MPLAEPKGTLTAETQSSIKTKFFRDRCEGTEVSSIAGRHVRPRALRLSRRLKRAPESTRTTRETPVTSATSAISIFFWQFFFSLRLCVCAVNRFSH